MSETETFVYFQNVVNDGSHDKMGLGSLGVEESGETVSTTRSASEIVTEWTPDAPRHPYRFIRRVAHRGESRVV